MAAAPPGTPSTVVEEILVGTNLAIGPDNYVSQNRSPATTYFRYDVSIPTIRDTGQIQWPGSPPDPASEFVTVGASKYPDSGAFLARLKSELARQPVGDREIVVFTHGYNTNFPEGVYRLAQMHHDFNVGSVPVFFGWPTNASAIGYVHDRDSVLYSRQAFEDFLRLVRRANPDRLIVFTHSLGSLLTTEVMRQAELRQPGSVPDLIDSLVMMSPDIDIDLFLSQVSDIQELPKPFIVFTSDEDKALRLSRKIGGNKPRLGNPPDLSRFSDIDVTFLDVSAFADGQDGDFGHLTPATSPELIEMIPNLREISQSLNRANAVNPDLATATVLTIRNATEVVLVPGSAQ